MTYDIVFHGGGDEHDGEVDGPFFLCSIGAWGRFIGWAESLPPDFAAVKTFAGKGEVKGTDELSCQLLDALALHSPEEDVAGTVAALLDKMGVGDPEETVAVIDD